jgi:hypothetical protein
VGRLNSVFGDRAFYRPEAWRGVDVESDLKALMDRGFSRLDESGKYAVNVLLWRNHRLTRIDTIDDPKLWLGGDVTRFNLAMFRAAYGDVIEPARRQRVRIEAVADEQGDDSHILRFTFPKPSSIFLENCGTFMVYLLMCNRQREYLEEYHPWGVDRMVTFDVRPTPPVRRPANTCGRCSIRTCAGACSTRRRRTSAARTKTAASGTRRSRRRSQPSSTGCCAAATSSTPTPGPGSTRPRNCTTS